METVRTLRRNRPRKVRQEHIFDVVAAGALALKLRALDAMLCSTPEAHHRELDLAALAQSDTTTQTVADTEMLDGLRALVKPLRRPELIPDAFVELYTAALQGRVYINVFRNSEPYKGPNPTCSEVLRLLPDIDNLLDTSLCAHFDPLNDQGM